MARELQGCVLSCYVHSVLHVLVHEGSTNQRQGCLSGAFGWMQAVGPKAWPDLKNYLQSAC